MASGKKEDTLTGDLQHWCNIDDDESDHNPYSQTARSRSASKKRVQWSDAPQFGPLPTAGSNGTEAASSSQKAAPEDPVDSRFGPLPIVDETGSGATTMPKKPATENHYRRQPVSEVTNALHRQQNMVQPSKSSSEADNVDTIRNELPLIPFDGDIRQYPAFRNRFLTIVEYLRGEPRHLTIGFHLTDANYFHVVNWLEETYGDQDTLRRALNSALLNLRTPSNKAADLHRFHDEAFAVANELKQLGEDVDASHIYEHILMGRLSKKLQLKLIRNYGCDREKSVSAILNGLCRYANDRQTAKTSSIRFDALFARVPSDRNPEGSIDYLDDAGAKQTIARVQTKVANFYPPTHPADAAQRTRDADGGTTAEPTCGRHVSQHRDHDKSMFTISRVTSTTAATRRYASRSAPLPIVDRAGAETEEVPQHQAHQSRPSASRFGPLPIVDSTAAEAVLTPQYPAAPTTSARPDPGPLPEKDCAAELAASLARNAAHILGATYATSDRGCARTAHPFTVSEDSPDAVPLISHLLTEDERHALIENLVNTVTELYSAVTPAQAALVAAARADPLDQEDNTFHVFLMAEAEARRDRVPDTAIPPAPTTCCAPDEAPPIAKQVVAARRRPATAASGSRSSSGAMTPPVSTTDRYTPVARRLPVGTLQGQAASSQGDDVRVRSATRDDSPLKNETVCFCDGSTFLYYGCLLRPEVLMVPTPMPSLEDALQSVYNFQPNNDVRRVIFWLSDSQSTPLSPALQFRMVTELSRHYATQYPAVKQYVVATPTIGSRQDVWTCGLFKLLVQMEVVLPYADVIMNTRGSRSVTHADVYHLKCYLHVHHHLDLWSRYDAVFPQAVKASHSPPTPQQRHATRATTFADNPAVETPDASQPRSQRRPLPRKANATSEDGTTSGTMRAGPDCLATKEEFRQHGDLRARPAAQSFTRFPPPPLRSRFHATLLSAPHDPTQARKLKARSCSRSALPPARELPKMNSRGKKKNHPLSDEVHDGSMRTQAPPAPAKTPKQPVTQQPSKSRFGPLPIVDQTGAETAATEDNARRPAPRAICAFCALPHWAFECTTYRCTAHRVRRTLELRYCIVCLRSGHTVDACSSRKTCRICHGRHHRALCLLAAATVANREEVPFQPTPPTVPRELRKPRRSHFSTAVPSAAQKPPTPEPDEAQHRRKARKRKDRELKK